MKEKLTLGLLGLVNLSKDYETVYESALFIFLHFILSSVFAENISASTTVMRVWGASEFIRN